MSDFETVTIAGSKAEQAVSYILQRVINDRNFSWYMFGTQSLRLCIQAEAERLQISEEEFERQLNERYKQASPRLERNGCGTADVVRLREQIEKAVARINELLAEGEIDSDDADDLTEMLERY